MVFPVVMYGCESWSLKESWAPKNWWFWTVVLEKTLESPLDCKEIQPVHSEGDQPWVFIGRTDAKAETPIFWAPHAKNWLVGKDPDTGKDWRQKQKGMTEDELVEWHHRLDGHEFEWSTGVGDGQGSLACCSQLVTKCWPRLRDWTNWLNWREFTVLRFTWVNVCSVKPYFLLICTKAFGFSPVSEYNFEQDNLLS